MSLLLRVEKVASPVTALKNSLRVFHEFCRFYTPFQDDYEVMGF